MRIVPEERIGATIGERYTLRAVIGSGGGSWIYEATDARLDAIVAVKILNKRGTTRERRLEREARVTAAIRHPNVCHVTDFGRTDDNIPYLVMERLEGETLADRLGPEGRIDVEEAVSIGSQILSVLAIAHELGIVHRDVKPQNLFLANVRGRAPLVKVLDFGVAARDTDFGLTVKGTRLGTPSYMAPEQAAALPDVDSRADLYACGAVLFRCLTGRRPFVERDEVALIHAIMRGQPPLVRSLRPDLPLHVAGAVDRALSADRDARFQTALEMLEALEGRAGTPDGEWDHAAARFQHREEERSADAPTDRIRWKPQP